MKPINSEIHTTSKNSPAKKQDNLIKWEKPSLTLLGLLRNIVQGGGKSGTAADGEGFKKGVG